MDAHPLGAMMRQRSTRRLIALLMLFSIICGLFVAISLFTHSAAHAAGGVQINAGGPAVSPFIADTDFTGGSTAGSNNTISTSGVTNPAPVAVYQTNRYGNFTYAIPGLTASTSYTVRLHFAETYWTAAGKRTFNVSINGTQALSNFDIFAAAGGANIAVAKQFTITADTSGAITIQFTTVNDNAQVNGIEVLGSGTTPTPTPTSIPATGGTQINSGGPAVAPFVADMDFNGGSTAGTGNSIDTSGVSNPAPVAVYQSNRFGNFTYTIPNLTHNASYTVNLHFAETYWTAAGQRTFNVIINGQTVLNSFDIVAAAGAPNKAVVKSFTATADGSGNLTIQFVTVKDNAQVNGIEVISSNATPTPTPTPNPNLVSWPVFDGNSARTGTNTAETTITTGNVGQLKQLWQQTLPSVADGAPVELPNVNTPSGIKTLLFLTTKNGSILAIDAATGVTIWSKTTTGPNYTTSSPAIDPSNQFVYSYGLDGKVHKYAVGNGAETTDSTWPVTTTMMPTVEKGSSPLNIANGRLYMPMGGYFGDGGHYEGHIVAVNLSSGAVTVFNSLCANIKHVLGPNDCSDVQSAIWGRGAPVIDPVTGNVFVATGNGPFRADGLSYGDSVIELSPDLSTVVDSYTPTNFQALQNQDQDLGSADPLMLPKQANSKTPYLAVQGGKDNVLRLINRQNLSGQGGPNHTGGELQTIAIPQGGDIDTHPVAWNDASGTTWVFVANFNGFDAYKVITNAQGQTSLQLAYQNGNSGSSPFIANNILFVEGDHALRAMDPTTGNVLWSSAQASAGGNIGALHWESPIVVNGHIYVSDDNGKFYAYGLN